MPRKEGLDDSQGSFPCGGGGTAIYTTGMHGTFCLTEISERGTIPYFGMKVLRNVLAGGEWSNRALVPELLHSKAHDPHSSCCLRE